ncbi:MAG: hypothetical protein ACOCQ4_02675, partial [bacterium]
MTKLLYASRGIYSILRVSFYPLPCVQADKATAGLKATPRRILPGRACTLREIAAFQRNVE